MIKIRLSPVEASAWKAAAKAANLTVSEWVRRRVVGVVQAVPPPPAARAPKSRRQRR